MENFVQVDLQTYNYMLEDQINYRKRLKKEKEEKEKNQDLIKEGNVIFSKEVFKVVMKSLNIEVIYDESIMALTNPEGTKVTVDYDDI